MITGWWFQPRRKILVSWDYYSQYMEKQMFQTTNQISDMELRPPHFSLLTLWKSMEFPDFHVEKRLPPSSAMALSSMFTRKCLNIFTPSPNHKGYFSCYVWQPQLFEVGVTVMATAIIGWDSKSFKPSRSWGELDPLRRGKKRWLRGWHTLPARELPRKSTRTWAPWLAGLCDSNLQLKIAHCIGSPQQGRHFRGYTSWKWPFFELKTYHINISGDAYPLKTGTFWGRSANI